jgi:hypothetical protein
MASARILLLFVVTCFLRVLHRHIAVTHGAHVQVWRTPNHLVREFAPFVLHRTYTGHHDDVLSIQWSPDSLQVALSKHAL